MRPFIIKVIKVFLLLTVFFTAAVAGYFLFFKNQNGIPQNVVTVKRGEIVEVSTITGHLVPSRQANLAFEKGGRLVNWYVNPGDHVHAGQLLATLESSETRAQIIQAEAGVDRAYAQFNQAVATLDAAELREMELEDSSAPYEQIATQAAHVREGEAAVSAQRASVQQAQASLDAAHAQSNKNNLGAPFDGVFAQQFIDPGEVVNPGAKAGLLISSDRFHIEANVPEVDIARVSIGNRVSVTLDALLAATFQGEIETIESAETIVDSVVNFKIIIKLLQTDPRFRSGLTANLSIETARRDNVLLLPEYAVIEKDEGVFVEKVENGVSKEVPLTIGVRDSNGNVEVLSGLNENDVVIASGLRTSP